MRRSWEGLFLALALAFAAIAPFTCCLILCFLALSAASVWLAFVPRVLGGERAGVAGEVVRVLYVASPPAAGAAAWLAESARALPPLGLPLVIDELLAWQLAAAQGCVLAACLLRAWARGNLGGFTEDRHERQGRGPHAGQGRARHELHPRHRAGGPRAG